MKYFNEDTLKKHMGEFIAKNRKSFGYTQEDLAALIESNPNTLSKIENGHMFISAKILCKLCETFKLPASAFFNNEDHICANEAKLNEIIQRLRLGGEDKIDFYYEMLNLIDKKYE